MTSLSPPLPLKEDFGQRATTRPKDEGSSCEVGKLTRTDQYRRVYREARRVKAGLLWAYICPSEKPEVKVGISISRTVIRKAVKRNLLRRIIRGWFRQNISRISHGIDAVVVVKKSPPIGRAGSRAIREELAQMFGIAV